MHGECSGCGKRTTVYEAIDGKRRCARCHSEELARRLARVQHGGKEYVAR